MKKIDEKMRTEDKAIEDGCERGHRKMGKLKQRDTSHKGNRRTERSARPKNGNLIHAPTPNRENDEDDMTQNVLTYRACNAGAVLQNKLLLYSRDRLATARANFNIDECRFIREEMQKKQNFFV